jgi:uncharacterized LabA/DUF88 family protein
MTLAPNGGERPPLFMASERVGLFIDGANLYSASRVLGFDIDYRKLLAWFAARANLRRAFYYTALLETEEYSPLRPLTDFLMYNGYQVVTKPAKQFTDSQGRTRIKGNMDIELAIDMLEMAPHLDHAVLFSGDGDFRRLIEAVQRKGLRVTVASTIRVQPPMIADELRRQADQFIDLEDLKPDIARRTFEPRERGELRDRPAAEPRERLGPSRATPANPFGAAEPAAEQ